MSESFLLGGILAVVGGFLDAYTYLLRGGVFANAQTGNIVLLGLYAARFHFAKAFYYLIPISAFIMGVIIVEAVKWKFREYHLFNGNAYATTMCTGNLRSASESLCRYAITKDSSEREKSLRYYGIILFFIGGAVLGTWMSGVFAEKAVLFCCGLLATAFLLMFLEK